MTGDYDDVLASLRIHLAEVTGEAVGLPEAQATALAEQIVTWLQQRFGGQEVYIRARSREERDRAILAAFNGTNRDQVCRTYRISKRTFYAILARN